jgi:hypothetical protein
MVSASPDLTLNRVSYKLIISINNIIIAYESNGYRDISVFKKCILLAGLLSPSLLYGDLSPELLSAIERVDTATIEALLQEPLSLSREEISLVDAALENSRTSLIVRQTLFIHFNPLYNSQLQNMHVKVKNFLLNSAIWGLIMVGIGAHNAGNHLGWKWSLSSAFLVVMGSSSFVSSCYNLYKEYASPIHSITEKTQEEVVISQKLMDLLKIKQIIAQMRD